MKRLLSRQRSSRAKPTDGSYNSLKPTPKGTVTKKMSLSSVLPKTLLSITDSDHSGTERKAKSRDKLAGRGIGYLSTIVDTSTMSSTDDIKNHNNSPIIMNWSDSSLSDSTDMSSASSIYQYQVITAPERSSVLGRLEPDPQEPSPLQSKVSRDFNEIGDQMFKGNKNLNLALTMYINNDAGLMGGAYNDKGSDLQPVITPVKATTGDTFFGAITPGPYFQKRISIARQTSIAMETSSLAMQQDARKATYFMRQKEKGFNSPFTTMMGAAPTKMNRMQSHQSHQSDHLFGDAPTEGLGTCILPMYVSEDSRDEFHKSPEEFLNDMFHLILASDESTLRDSESDLSDLLKNKRKRENWRRRARVEKKGGSIASMESLDDGIDFQKKLDKLNKRKKRLGKVGCWSSELSKLCWLSLGTIMIITAIISVVAALVLLVFGLLGPMDWDKLGLLLLSSFYLIVGVACILAMVYRSVLWLDLLGVGVNVTFITIVIVFMIYSFDAGNKLSDGVIETSPTWPPEFTKTEEGTFAYMVPWEPTPGEITSLVLVSTTCIIGAIYLCFLVGLARSLKPIFEIGGSGFEGMNYVEIIQWLEGNDQNDANLIVT